jgi:hypothetical protein
MDAKTKAIISHIPVLGWVIALVINMNQKEEYASFYIRQNLGFMVAWFVVSVFMWFPIINWIAWIGYVVVGIFWLMSLIWAVTDVMKPIPWLGKQFQEWFKSL